MKDGEIDTYSASQKFLNTRQQFYPGAEYTDPNGSFIENAYIAFEY